MFKVGDKVRIKNLPEGTHQKWAQHSGATGMICRKIFDQVCVYFEDKVDSEWFFFSEVEHATEVE